MRLHISGNSVILLSPKGKLCWSESGNLTSEPLPPNIDISNEERNGMLCVTPKGERDFSARLIAANALAAEALDEENVAALIQGQEGIYLVRGPVSINTDWPSMIDVSSAEPTRVKWPAGLIWKKNDSSLYDLAQENGTGITDQITPTLTCNKYGTAIASPGNGTIMVIRPNEKTTDFCLQLPSQEDTTLFAYPTKQGVLVTLIVDAQDSAYLHIGEDGTILAYQEAQSAIPALVLNKGFLLFDSKSCSLQLLDSNFKLLSKKKAPWTALESACSFEGNTFALADSGHVLHGHVNVENELIFVAEFNYTNHDSSGKSPGELAASAAKWDPERCHGRPAVGFAAAIKQESWGVTTGEDFELALIARSTGGKGKGITISLGGDAMKYCEFHSVRIEGEEVSFQKNNDCYEANFPTLELKQGISFPLNPKPKNDAQKHAAVVFMDETHIKLTLQGKAKEKSAELMTVTISATRSQSPALKWMRPLSIS